MSGAMHAIVRLRARAETDGTAGPGDDGLQTSERSLSAELAAEKAFKARKDVLLEETARIVGDEVSLLAGSKRLAVGN